MSFFTALKAKFDESQLLFTISIPISEEFDYQRFDVSALSGSVEFITFIQNTKYLVESFDDAINALQIYTLEQEVDRLINSGVPAEKVVLGLDFTGFGFTIAPDTSDEDGKFDRIYRYNEVSGLLLTDPRKWNVIHKEPSLTIVKGKQENVIIVIESTRSIANKVRMAIKRGFAGIAPTAIAFDEVFGLRKIDQDTFDDFVTYDGVNLNIPQRADRQFPLLNAINEAIEVAQDELTQEANLPEPPVPTTTTTPERSITQRATKISPDNPEATTLNKRSKRPEQALEAVLDKNKKVVCQVYPPSYMAANKINLDIGKVDWNLCTHLVSIDTTGEGIVSTITHFSHNLC